MEGAALAVAVIEALRKKGARLAATTHYSELKEYALHTDRVENASCEFSVETLSPTYRLLIGVPGRSNAFAISERLGLRREILDDAEALVSSENRRFEDVVDALERSRAELEQEKARVLEREAQIDRLRAQAEETKREAAEKGQRELERAKREAAALTENARRAANSLLLEVERLKKEQAKEKDAAAAARKARAAMKAKLGELDDLTAESFGTADDGEYTLPRELRVGDTVFVTTLGTQATVVSVPDARKNVEVQAGAMKMKVGQDVLRLMKGKPKTSPAPRRPVSEGSRPPAQSTAMRVDLRGKNAEEAILDLDMFLDSAVRAGLNEVTIVHGKGTGVLRKAVQAHLRKHPQYPDVPHRRVRRRGRGRDHRRAEISVLRLQSVREYVKITMISRLIGGSSTQTASEALDMKKKIIAAALAMLAVACVITACGGDETTYEPVEYTTDANGELYVTNIYGDLIPVTTGVDGSMELLEDLYTKTAEQVSEESSAWIRNPMRTATAAPRPRIPVTTATTAAIAAAITAAAAPAGYRSAPNLRSWMRITRRSSSGNAHFRQNTA